jgi:hypothetical protein
MAAVAYNLKKLLKYRSPLIKDTLQQIKRGLKSLNKALLKATKLIFSTKNQLYKFNVIEVIGLG